MPYRDLSLLVVHRYLEGGWGEGCEGRERERREKERREKERREWGTQQTKLPLQTWFG